MPSSGEPTPLVLPLTGPRKDDQRLSDNMIHRTIKTMITSASKGADAQRLGDVASALAKASTHWLRHTSLTHLVDDGVPLSTLRDNARHASIATTSAYLRTDDRERHAETNEKLKMGIRRRED
jgi:integrase/recombinase XerD